MITKEYTIYEPPFNQGQMTSCYDPMYQLHEWVYEDGVLIQDPYKCTGTYIPYMYQDRENAIEHLNILNDPEADICDRLAIISWAESLITPSSSRCKQQNNYRLFKREKLNDQQKV